MCSAYLLAVLLVEQQGEALMQLEAGGVPAGFQRAVLPEDLVDDGQHVAGAWRVVGGRITAATAGTAVSLGETEKYH